MSRSRLAPLLPLAVVVLMTAGCAPEIPPSPTSSGDATPSAEATPSPAPAKPDLAEIVVAPEGLLTPSGIGDVLIGEPVPEVGTALAIVEYIADYCVYENGPSADDPFAGAWIAAYPGIPSSWGESPVFWIATEDGLATSDVVGIGVREGVRTEPGVGVGSTLDELEAAYPAGFDDEVEGWASFAYAIETEGSRLVFEVPHDPGSLPGYWDGSGVGLDAVAWISVQRTSFPLGTIAGSDAGGPCPV